MTDWRLKIQTSMHALVLLQLRLGGWVGGGRAGGKVVLQKMA